MEIIETERGLALDVVIELPHGLHSRPSAKVAQTARQYDAKLQILAEEGEVDARSMLDILSLALGCNARVRLLASGPQASEALLAVAAVMQGQGEASGAGCS